ncbi:DNA-binding protein [Rivihabitans pingtungensis]|uniref:Gp16 family phage-associated protein n=1 Tax=Rivihabitans pingtungensis TaxID=1054498 RepID=A0A318L092_9NEIS|nr:DNA-binding protein [Rivihabitans pingtungensis]MCK6437748.1 DNA-binding protein [Rivihabitans pingtungensis]PXX81365.1 gp16 family phage-associated protein [Rivihabitans pingtungensis]
MSHSNVMTPEELKAKFEREGRTFSSWALEHGYNRIDVYKVLSGICKAKRGKGHQIAVQLGLKPQS